VEVDVLVGSSISSLVLRIGRAVELLDVGVSSSGVRVAAGVSVVWEAGTLQDDTPMTIAMLTIHKRFLILSSFFYI
jgi:hypothetical protein